MKWIANITVAALGCCTAIGAAPANAATISNPTNSYSLGSLSGDLTGGNQTQYLGETFTAPSAAI